MLAACAVASFGALARVWLDWTRSLAFVPGRRNWLVFWGATALGLLIKGPIVPMVWGLAVLGMLQEIKPRSEARVLSVVIYAVMGGALLVFAVVLA